MFLLRVVRCGRRATNRVCLAPRDDPVLSPPGPLSYARHIMPRGEGKHFGASRNLGRDFPVREPRRKYYLKTARIRWHQKHHKLKNSNTSQTSAGGQKQRTLLSCGIKTTTELSAFDRGPTAPLASCSVAFSFCRHIFNTVTDSGDRRSLFGLCGLRPTLQHHANAPKKIQSL